MLEKARDKLVILDLVDVFLLERALPLPVHPPGGDPIVGPVALGVGIGPRGRLFALVLVVGSHDFTSFFRSGSKSQQTIPKLLSWLWL